MKKNVAGQIIGGQMNSKTDGSAVTSGTTTVYVTGDGGTQAAGSVGSGACTHEGQGFWTYAPAQAETNYDHVAFTFTNTSAVAATVQLYPSFPQTGDSFARIGAPTGASISADVVAVKADTAAILVDTGTTLDGRIPAALVGGRMDSSVGAMAANVLTATAINADAITDAKVAADVTIASVTGAVGSVTGAVGSVTGAVGSVAAGGITAASFAANAITAAKLDPDVTTELQAGLATSAALATLQTTADAIPTNAELATALDPLPTAVENADALLGRTIAGGADGGRMVKDALRSLRNKTVISGGTLTVYQEDDATSAWTAAVTTTAGDPLSSIDPA